MKKISFILLITMVISMLLPTAVMAEETADEQAMSSLMAEAIAVGVEEVVEEAGGEETEGETTPSPSPSPSPEPTETPEPTPTATPEPTPTVMPTPTTVPTVTPDATPSSAPTSTPNVPEAETPLSTPSGNNGELTVHGATRLQIDDANVYEDMDKAYKDGYLPTVEDGVVTLVLPLIADGDISGSQITVTPNLGDSYSSPIQYRNYQKTFPLEEHLVNEKRNEDSERKEYVEAYRVCFDFPLKSDRKNGTYPVSLTVQAQSAGGSLIQQTYICYITITDGKDTEAGSVPNVNVGMAVMEEAPESQPRILISKYSIDSTPVPAGEEFIATVTLRNTSETMSVQNMVVTVSCDSANFVLKNDSSTIYIDKLGAGETMDVEIKYDTDLETAPQRYNINLAMSYDNSDAMSLSSSGSIIVEVAQVPDVELAPFNIEPEVNAGETMQISFQVLNLGRSPIYNARIELSAPGLYPVGTGFVGNMEPGTSATTNLDVFIGMKEDSEERYGATNGTVTLIYEDAGGEEYVQEVEIDTNIQALIISAPAVEEEEEEKTAGQWWFSVGIGGLVIAALAVSLGRKRTYKSKHVKL